MSVWVTYPREWVPEEGSNGNTEQHEPDTVGDIANRRVKVSRHGRKRDEDDGGGKLAQETRERQRDQDEELAHVAERVYGVLRWQVGVAALALELVVGGMVVVAGLEVVLS